MRHCVHQMVATFVYLLFDAEQVAYNAFSLKTAT